jgi:hypothetical protein
MIFQFRLLHSRKVDWSVVSSDDVKNFGDRPRFAILNMRKQVVCRLIELTSKYASPIESRCVSAQPNTR